MNATCRVDARVTNKVGKVISFRALLEEVPLGARQLRALIARLGFRAAPGMKFYFSEDQVETIKLAMIARRDAVPSLAREWSVQNQRIARTRETRRLIRGIRP